MKYILDAETGKLLREKKEEIVAEGSKQEICLVSPEKFKTLEGKYPHRKNLNRSMGLIQYCKIEVYSECVLGTMRVPKGREGKIEIHSFGFYLHGNQLFFLEEGNWVKNVLENMRYGAYEACTLQQFLIQFFEVITEEDVLYLQQLESALEKLEEELIAEIPENFHEKIMKYRKNLSELHAYYEQMMNVGDIMQTNISQKLSGEEYAAWQHYTKRAERLHNHVEQLREYLIQIREMYQAQIDVQQNRMMSFLTVVTTIFLPLTLIAGWYGMNFRYMPEYAWKYAYPVVIVVSIFIIIIEIIYFKKKKML